MQVGASYHVIPEPWEQENTSKGFVPLRSSYRVYGSRGRNRNLSPFLSFAHSREEHRETKQFLLLGTAETARKSVCFVRPDGKRESN